MQKVYSCQRHQPYDFFGKINNFWKQWVKSFWLNVLKNRFGQYLWSKYWIRSTIICYQLTFYQLTCNQNQLLSASSAIQRFAIKLIYYQLSCDHIHLLSSLICYQASFAIKPHLLSSLNFYRHIYFQASLANRPTSYQSSVAINNFAINHHLP